MADPQDKGNLAVVFQAIHRKITASATRNHKLTQPVTQRTADQWVKFEHGHSSCDQANGFRNSFWEFIKEKFCESLQVLKGSGRIYYFRHDCGFGRLALPLRALLRM